MSDTLGLHISEQGPDGEGGIAAVRLDAVAGVPPSTIWLGTDSPVTPCRVAQGEDGTVVVGHAVAAGASAVVTDPLVRAGRGQIGPLGSIINHVIGRATTTAGTAPRRVAIVVPDDWAVAPRDQVVAAGAVAGVADTVVVPYSAAAAQSVDVDPDVALAAGAAAVASLASVPLVTREDLGDPVEPKAPVVLPSAEPTGPTSVFDPEPEDEHATPVPAVGAAGPAPSPTPAPVPATPSPPTASLPPEPLRYEPPNRRLSGLLIAIGVLLGLIGAVAIALFIFADDDEPTTTADPVETSTTLDPALTTTLATTTTMAAPTTTASVATDATSSSSTSTTTTTTESPTTTTPVPVAEPGAVTLAETGLRLDDGSLVLFDQDDEAAIVSLEAVLGSPDRDRDYEELSFCDDGRHRLVQWGDLELVFTEDEPDSGVGRFTQWYATGYRNPEGLVTFSGIGVTATVGYLEVTLGSALELVAPIPDVPAGLFAAANPSSGAVLNGTTTSLDPDGIVNSLWAGDSCTRVLD